ncbi:MAG: sulfurtransferase, partial [Dokdonella sp.]
MILNIAAYRFVEIDDPEHLMTGLRDLAGENALLGTILVAREGLNLFLAGPDLGIESFLAGLLADARFSGMEI